MENENQKIDQKDINAAAWAACDTFRGVVDPAQYKDYILVILFLRYISDVWQDHYDTYKKEYGDDDERIRRKLERERFVLPVIKLTEEVNGKRKEIDSFTANETRPIIILISMSTLPSLDFLIYNIPPFTRKSSYSDETIT